VSGRKRFEIKRVLNRFEKFPNPMRKHFQKESAKPWIIKILQKVRMDRSRENKEGRPTPETPYDLERTDIKVGYLIE
jgi:hypothetical protein